MYFPPLAGGLRGVKSKLSEVLLVVTDENFQSSSFLLTTLQMGYTEYSIQHIQVN